MYGYSREEFLGMHAIEISDEPEKSAAHIEQVASEEATGLSARPVFRYHRKKDGTVFPVEVSSGVYTLRDRKYVCAIIRDVTERVQVEEALRQSLNELESQVKQRTADLVTVNRELRREMEDRKQFEKGLLESEEKLYDDQKRIEMIRFANEVSLNLMHELRNPLVCIGGFSRRLCGGEYELEKIKEYAKVILEESMKLENVLDKVLAHLKTAVSHT